MKIIDSVGLEAFRLVFKRQATNLQSTIFQK